MPFPDAMTPAAARPLQMEKSVSGILVDCRLGERLARCLPSHGQSDDQSVSVPVQTLGRKIGPCGNRHRFRTIVTIEKPLARRFCFADK